MANGPFLFCEVVRARPERQQRSGAALRKYRLAGDPRETGAQRLDQLFERKRAKREEHRYRRPKGYDAGKKVSGIKRHIADDTQGLPHAIAITTANVTDRQRGLDAMGRCKPNLRKVQSILVDSGYPGKPFAKSVKELLKATMQVVKRDQLHTIVVLPRRWGVERSFAWLDKCRRLWKNCERKLNTSLQFVHLAFLVQLLRRS